MAPTPPGTLVRYIRDRRCVLFCGSGLSAWAKLPTWKKLLQDIVQQLGEEIPDNPDMAEVNRLIEAGKLLQVADYCREALGRRYHEILSERLRGTTEQIPEPHRQLVQLPLSAVVTTNYDKLLERSYAAASRWPKTPTHLDVDMLGPLLFDGSFFILKAHGDIDRPESMVLTTRDYQQLIHANPAFHAVFSAILMTKAILFIGYSLSDPDFQLLLDRQLTSFQGSIPDRYALMSGVGKVEREVLWRTARIRVLPYDDGKHEQVLEFLQTLVGCVREGDAAQARPPIPAPGATAGEFSRMFGSGAAEPPAAVPRPAQPGPQSDPRESTGAFRIPAASPPPAPAEIPGQFKSLFRQTSPAPPAALAADTILEPSRAPAPPAALLSLQRKGASLEVRIVSNGASASGLGTPPRLETVAKLVPDALRQAAKARNLGQLLAGCLPDSVLQLLAATPKGQPLGLQLSPDLERFPWEWTVVGGEFLLLRQPVVRSPAGISDTARGYPTVREPARVLLIGDPNQSDSKVPPLPGALAEVREIARIYSQRTSIACDSFIGNKATFDNVAEALVSGRYDVVHFAGHAWFDDEPFLFLAQGFKLHSSEMRSLLSPHPPAILFLNSHYTVFMPPGALAEEPGSSPEPESRTALSGQQGFIEAASTAGVGTLIGSFSGGLDDATAQHVGIHFHQALFSGVTVAGALHKVVLTCVPATKGDGVSHLTYAMSGYGDIALAL